MDTTTLYFEGRGGSTLGQKGHSKDYRPHLNQMVVGICQCRFKFPHMCRSKIPQAARFGDQPLA
jgi:hypothetical protein